MMYLTVCYLLSVSCLLTLTSAAAVPLTNPLPKISSWTKLSDVEKVEALADVADTVGFTIDHGILLGEDEFGNECYLSYDHELNQAVVSLLTVDGQVMPLVVQPKPQKEKRQTNVQLGLGGDRWNLDVGTDFNKNHNVKFTWKFGKRSLSRDRRQVDNLSLGTDGKSLTFGVDGKHSLGDFSVNGATDFNKNHLLGGSTNLGNLDLSGSTNFRNHHQLGVGGHIDTSAGKVGVNVGLDNLGNRNIGATFNTNKFGDFNLNHGSGSGGNTWGVGWKWNFGKRK